MKYFLILIYLSATSAFSQSFEQTLTELEVLRIEKKLSSNEFQGRKPGTPGIEKAASFIEEEFKNAGLSYLPGLNSFRQQFSIFQVRTLDVTASADGKTIEPNHIVVASQLSKRHGQLSRTSVLSSAVARTSTRSRRCLSRP